MESMSVHHLRGIKQIVVMLNRRGNGLSFDKLRASILTVLQRSSWQRTEGDRVVLPSNIAPSSSPQVAEDKNGITDEQTLNDKSTTSTTAMVVYERRQSAPRGGGGTSL